ncbi:MAG: hypothetical protein IT433_01330 [Phycisphaerales bacterium]|nr:hypothetical protein [Phycisphaerales bacterium]
MAFLTHLWLPLLLSGVFVWIASAVAWMAIGHHKQDRDAVPGGPEMERSERREDSMANGGTEREKRE